MMENKDYVRAHHAKLREYKVRPYKEEGEAIGEYAKAMGMSVQGLFLEAVREYMTTHPSPSASSDGIEFSIFERGVSIAICATIAEKKFFSAAEYETKLEAENDLAHILEYIKNHSV